VKVKSEEIIPEEPKTEEKLKLKKLKEEESSPENCDRDVRLGKKGEFGVFPFISFPGSGNTWTRLLLEDVTGIYTGSIYTDGSLKNGGFVGEFTEPENGETLFQKAHVLNKQIFPAAKGMLFLIRNPYDAVVAEFKRIKGHGHTSVVSEDLFKKSNPDWQKRSHLFIQKWLDLIKGTLAKHHENNRPIHVFYYEDLKKNATFEMEKILDFVEEEKYFVVPDRDRRIKCLKTLMGESEKFHRPKTPPSFEYFSKSAILKANLKIQEAHDLLRQFNLPLFNIEDYLRSI